jgi:hypothetical protein
MWPWIVGRLDRRWKRIASIVWVPFLFISFLFFVYGLINIYIVRYADDPSVFDCHIRMAMKHTFSMSDTFTHTDADKRKLGVERYDSRTSLSSPYSAETRMIERDPIFMGCMSDTPHASWWLEYPFVWAKVIGFFLWNGLIALIIFPRFWGKIGRWAQMKPET